MWSKANNVRSDPALKFHGQFRTEEELPPFKVEMYPLVGNFYFASFVGCVYFGGVGHEFADFIFVSESEGQNLKTTAIGHDGHFQSERIVNKSFFGFALQGLVPKVECVGYDNL